MLPDLLEPLGLDLRGLWFERLVWLLACGLGAWGVYGGLAERRDGAPGRGWLRVVLSAAFLAWAGVRAWGAWVASPPTRVITGEFVLRTYAATMVTGFAVGTWLTARAAQRVGVARGVILDLAFWCLLAGMVGARLTFVGVNHELFIDACFAPERLGLARADCFKAVRFWEGGLVFYGSFIGAAAALLVYARRRGAALGPLVDATAPSLAIGHAIGRLGCLAAGCCWGAVCPSGVGVRYDAASPAYEAQAGAAVRGAHGLGRLAEGWSVPVHPVQLYEAAGEVVIFALLLAWRPHKRRHGELLGVWLLCYGVMRLLTETVRGDRARGHLLEWSIAWLNRALDVPADHVTLLSTSQLGALVAVVLGASVVIACRRGAAGRLRLA